MKSILLKSSAITLMLFALITLFMSTSVIFGEQKTIKAIIFRITITGIWTGISWYFITKTIKHK